MKINQTVWENWFVASCIILLGILFVGTIDNSKELIPYYPYYLIVAAINLCICIYIGINGNSDEDDNDRFDIWDSEGLSGAL